MRRLSVSNTVLLIICLMYLILYVDRVNISTAAPLIKADLNLSNTELGLAFSAFAYPYALFQLIGGYFGDKFGARLTLFSRDWRRRDLSDRDARDGGVGARA
jgi:sugar phosphate permease